MKVRGSLSNTSISPKPTLTLPSPCKGEATHANSLTHAYAQFLRVEISIDT